MYKIAYVVAYFGKFDSLFPLWLNSCRENPSIDFIVFTDDRTEYDYPKNVRATYVTLENMRERIQSNYDFEISLSYEYKICDYRPAYCEIFKEELKDYDFWGYCDVDLIFGNIRKFITDDILDRYERVGFQGHSTLFRNTSEVNLRYRYADYYKTTFTSEENCRFDEQGMDKIYDELKIAYYRKTNFAHLSPLKYNFYLRHLPQSEEYKNKNQIFKWENGTVKRIYLYRDEIFEEEFMYVHIFRRHLQIKVKNIQSSEFYIYPNVITDAKTDPDKKWLKKNTKNRQIKWYFEKFKKNKGKLTFKKIIFYIKVILSKEK